MHKTRFQASELVLYFLQKKIFSKTKFTANLCSWLIGCVLLDKFGFCNFGDLLSYLIINFYFMTWRLLHQEWRSSSCGQWGWLSLIQLLVSSTTNRSLRTLGFPVSILIWFFFFGIFILGKLWESLEICGFLPSFIRLLILPLMIFFFIYYQVYSIDVFVIRILYWLHLFLEFALLVMIPQFSVQQVLTTFRLVKIWLSFNLAQFVEFWEMILI